LGRELPLALLITPAGGLVLAKTIGSVCVLNVNGLFIKRVELERPVLAWATFATVEGFDFVVYWTDKHALLAVEAMFPECVTTVGKSRRLLALGYSIECECYIVVGQRAKVKLIPRKVRTDLSRKRVFKSI
jgi:hypothetical protein